MSMDRRAFLGAGMAASAMLGTPRAMAQQTGNAHVPPGVVRFPIWPEGQVPGAAGVRVREVETLRHAGGSPYDTSVAHVTRPTLSLVRPARPNGAALLLVPGGGYVHVAIGLEGFQIANWFARQGFTCYILLYRLPADGWAAGPDAPLQDAQRAMRVIRARAGEDGIDPDRVATIGFSAGGHVAARLATQSGLRTYQPLGATDRLSARPLLAGLLYPVISMLDGEAHGGSRKELLGAAPSEARKRAYSAQLMVDGGTPPGFLAHAGDDKVVPVANSIGMYQALRQHKVPGELHLFETGGHGFGLTLPDGTASPWPTLFTAFARRHGLIR